MWDAGFRDGQDAELSVDGQHYRDYSVFKRHDGKLAVVVVNTTKSSITAQITFPQAKDSLAWASPEEPALHPSTGTIHVPFRSAEVLMER